MMYILPIVLSIVYSSILGMLWYSDSLFGKPWKKAMDLSEKTSADMKEGASKAIASNLFMTVLTMIGLWIFILAMTTYSLTMEKDAFFGALIGGLVWLFFVVPTALQAVFFENRSWIVTRIGIAYRLAELLGAGAIMGSFL